jgi:hypothetical protein
MCPTAAVRHSSAKRHHVLNSSSKTRHWKQHNSVHAWPAVSKTGQPNNCSLLRKLLAGTGCSPGVQGHSHANVQMPRCKQEIISLTFKYNCKLTCHLV